VKARSLGAAVVLAVAASAAAGPRPAASGQQPTPALAALREGINRIAAREPVAAEAAFTRAIELARAEGNLLIEGRGLRGVGVAKLNQASYGAAREALAQAVRIFEQIDSKPDLAAALNELGNAEHYLDRAAAQRAYRDALRVFGALGDVREQANVYYNLSLDTEGTEAVEALQAGLALAERIEDAVLVGAFLHSWSDRLFQQGRLAEAMERVEEAIDGLTRAGDRGARHLATALTSLGRLHRAHGQHERALDAYRRAFAIQQAIGDRFGMLQSVNAMAVACSYLGRSREARQHFEEALESARKTSSPRVVAWTTANLAGWFIRNRDPARGIAMLEAVRRTGADDDVVDQMLGYGHLALGQYERAAADAGRAIAAMRERGLIDRQFQALVLRAGALDRLGRTSEALADAEDAVALIDRIRSDAVATDAMKTGFAGEYQEIFSLAIALLVKLDRPLDALAVAERARGRAFADLLASRDAWTPAGGSERRTADGELRSLVSIPPLSSADLVRVAAERQSTIVLYWVAGEATFIWIVAPGGRVECVRVAARASRMAELVRRAASTGGARDADRTQRLRGEGLLSLGTDAVAASRTLFDLLVRPIEHLLPREPGSLLTIVPHGPLFRLSFAALRDGGGRYLLERHAIHYVPAGVVLQLAAHRQGAPREPHYLLVGDPASPPPGPAGTLPRLPGARAEVQRVAQVVGRSRVTTLVGVRATERDVQRLAGTASVLHLATHGIVRGDDPLEFFLALGRDGESTPVPVRGSGATAAGSDGRLTVREIYDLRLHADLVVLSACGTGLGQVSGDGVAGLARAFIYAGSPAVVATLWDLADEPAARLIPAFYRSLQRGSGKAEALRRAQLGLLADLRAGRVTIPGTAGQVTLAEHPLLWAGFVLIGEP
jgi:CHAT domain-containing protein/tetratricopeptide (TPR) repeat protein